QELKLVSELPDELHESSGLIVLDSNRFLSHNDGGDGPKLYVFDSSGTIHREVYVRNASNVDWEELAEAPDGRVFIGDFGNNANKRTNLRIYVLPPFASWNTDTVSADTIQFTYADQTEFPPAQSNLFYDCEAMVYWRDSLHLFTKNWSSPFNGYTKHYVLPARAGSYSLIPIDSAYMGGFRELAFITSADIQSNKLVLLGSAYVWQFSIDSVIRLNQPKLITLNHLSQKEAIAIHNESLYITDESTGGFGNLYRMNLFQTSTVFHALNTLELKVWQRESTLMIKSVEPISSVEVLAVDGKQLLKQNFLPPVEFANMNVPVQGVVFLNVRLANGQQVVHKAGLQ
ncbi:MAG: hypothetical protein JJ975_15560, partial [Bacteroidia bacterium]|nr:hypothetical protein [Bacteroidia bacterium]